MRVYLPTTVGQLRMALEAGEVPATVGFAVTPDLQQEYPRADEEELEYLAMADAARASLRLLAAESSGGGPAGDAPLLRVVVAADVDDVTPWPQGDRAAVRVSGAVPWRRVAAVHLDGADAAPAVAEAVAAVDAADLGDDDAEFAVGEAESYELAWYAPDEVRFLVAELG